MRISDSYLNSPAPVASKVKSSRLPLEGGRSLDGGGVAPLQDPQGSETKQRRVWLTEQSQESDYQRRQFEESLSHNSLRALQAFEANAPSIEQRLGVEIVGVDTFV